jgi:excisionase family DNA binding protein
MEAYLDIREVAGILKLSVQTIRRYVLKKEIPFHKIKRAVRFKPSEIEWWVENRKEFEAANRNKNPDGALFEEIPLEQADLEGFVTDGKKTEKTV